jgi:pimeloyl-ACP methyl ester carboxylesterase
LFLRPSIRRCWLGQSGQNPADLVAKALLDRLKMSALFSRKIAPTTVLPSGGGHGCRTFRNRSGRRWAVQPAEAWSGLSQLTREAFSVRSHCETHEQARKNAAALTLEGIAQNVTCPIFVVYGRLDRIVPAANAERLARGTFSCPNAVKFGPRRRDEPAGQARLGSQPQA